jgi:murein DD-endopeptidase MepM/ murein hydrolase activator NlpD
VDPRPERLDRGVLEILSVPGPTVVPTNRSSDCPRGRLIPGPGSFARLARAILVLATLVVAGCAVPTWPVEGRLSSSFGMRRQGGFIPGIHHGVDIPLPVGTPVRAMLPGRVRFAGTMRGYGEVIWLEHRSGTLTVYAHLSEIDVRTGQQVVGRQIIGRSGASGNVTGPHLHFEVWKGGRPVDPVLVLGRPPTSSP